MRALTILNACLGALGESPLASEQDYHPFVADVALARSSAESSALAQGWWFNTERTKLYPQTDGTIRVPNDAVSCIPDSHKLFGQRGNRLWDTVKGTDKWEVAVAVRLVRALPLDDLPVLAADYVQAKTVLLFLRGKDADQAKIRDAQLMEREAYGLLHAEHIRATRLNTRQLSPVVLAQEGRALFRNWR